MGENVFSGCTGPERPTIASRSDAAMHAYIVTHIDEAVENGWVLPYYQPVVRTLTGKLCGMEALARWEDPTHGVISPAQFIPALEEARVIHLLDCSIVRQVCRCYREIADLGEQSVPISFNLSRLDFDLCDIFSEVERAAHEYGVPRRMLNVEITESVLGSDPSFMESHMRKFRDAGYQVWMDDFGSGYSTLNVLKDFEFDELKIDMEFLSRFGTKSKTILASVVDMAKKLGIQTLAEGVETEEHRSYLRRIGCEKMQGYLFGKPCPYSVEYLADLSRAMGIETASERLYLNEIGAINTLSLSERNLAANVPMKGYVTSMPLAMVEYSDDRFTVLDSNRVFRESLASVGIPSIEEAERRLNDLHRPLARQARRLMEDIEVDKFARADFMAGDIPCVIRAKHITTRDGKIAFLAYIDDTLEQSERKRHERMGDVLAVMYSIYDHVDILHLDEGFIEPVFGNVGLHAHLDAPTFDQATAHFANSEVYERDRARYMQFMNHDTIIERIEQSGENFIVGFFRLRQKGGDYAWKMVGLIRIEDHPGNLVMYCMRGTHWAHDGLFQAVFDGTQDNLSLHDLSVPDLTVSDAGLWKALVRDSHLNLFWKDSQRRFIGANRAFLEYYGFQSVDDIRGKTDEDMGWHIDPAPFKNDEWRVLREGAVIEGAPGHCIVDGEVRNIVATKRPVYRDGRIVGLVGYFNDVDDDRGSDETLDNLPIRDTMTGVLNYTGLEAATWRYVDSYRKQKTDFAMVSINVEIYERINMELGYEFGEKVLKHVADELIDIAGHQRVIGHVYADRFVVLVQGDSDEELQELCENIERRLLAIAQVDGTPCTIYALADFSRFSELGDVEAMKRQNRDSRMVRREKQTGADNPGDVITSTIL